MLLSQVTIKAPHLLPTTTGSAVEQREGRQDENDPSSVRTAEQRRDRARRAAQTVEQGDLIGQ